MPIDFTIAIDDVCTHAQLADEVGGTSELNKICVSGDSSAARTLALRDTLKSLGRRVPPVYASDISQPSELREAVIYGALERLYRDAMTSDGDVYAMKRKLYESQFRAEVLGLKLTTGNGSSAVVSSIRISRR